MQPLQFGCFESKNVSKTPSPALNPSPLTRHKSPSGEFLAAAAGTDRRSVSEKKES